MKIIVQFQSDENPDYIKAVQEDLQKQFEVDFCKIVLKKFDNPVPSLDNKDIKLILEALCAYGDDEEVISLCEKLENGVEANNEQPKIKCKCGLNSPTCDIECG